MARGGVRPGAGRKPKAEEEKTRRLALSGLLKAFGTEEKAFAFLGQVAKEEKSFNHAKLLFEYCYGKPKENISIDNENDLFKIVLPSKD